MIECITTGLLGFFIGAIWIAREINDISKEKEQIKRIINHLKEGGNLDIEQEVYACEGNRLYTGIITSIEYRKNAITIELNYEETFDIKNVYTDKYEALKQIKI